MSAALLRQVQAEKACLQTLVQALEEEDQALGSGRFADLPAIAQRKSALLARVAQIDRERESSQAQQGVPPGRAGSAAPARADPGLGQAWSELLALAARARLLNRLVAAKVYTHLDFTEKAIAFLQAGSPPLYGPDGERTGRARGASLAVG